MNMPHTPNTPENTTIEKITHKLFRPVESPKIFGPSMLPSNCCRMITNMRKIRHFFGSIIRMKNADGIAPMNGPKYGITFVIPTITEISTAYGILIMSIPK